MAENLQNSLSDNDNSRSGLPAITSSVELALQRTQMAVSLLRDVVQESSAEYWFEKGIEYKIAENWESGIHCFRRYNDMSGGSLIGGIFQAICHSNKDEKQLCVEVLFATQNHPEDTLFDEYASFVTENEWFSLYWKIDDRIAEGIIDPFAKMNYSYEPAPSIIRYAEYSSPNQNEFLSNFSTTVSVLYNQFISTHKFNEKSEAFYYTVGYQAPQSEFSYKFDIAVKLAEQLKGVEISKTFWPRKEGTIWHIIDQESFRCQHLFDKHTVDSFLKAIIKWMTGLRLAPEVIATYSRVFSID